jgi:iron(III) transport system substrate-binding protein
MPLVLFVLLLCLGACSGSDADVVLYCAQDQEHAESLIKEFEKRTNLRVRAQYDTEASKSVGLAQAIFEERHNPRCDVFWNNEPLNTIFLKNQAVLEPYFSPNAQSIPSAFKDKDGHWTGFAARARIIIANDKALSEADRPMCLRDLEEAKYRGRCVMAKPLAGTTATHMLVLFEVLGEGETKSFLEKLVTEGLKVASGNAHVMRQVREGTYAWGFTDTDDFNVALSEGYPVSAIYPDQGPDEKGTLVLPNTVALIRGAPHPENAKKLIDFLLSEEVERSLAFGRSAQIPLHPSAPHPDHVKVPGVDFRSMEVDFASVAVKRDERLAYLKRLFLR